jgi:hypothetical protein
MGLLRWLLKHTSLLLPPAACCCCLLLVVVMLPWLLGCCLPPLLSITSTDVIDYACIESITRWQHRVDDQAG